MLHIVPPSVPDKKQAVIERVKAMPRPSGMLQCKRCGSRTVMTTTTGASIDSEGRYKRGQVVDDRICYDCDKRGIFSQMLPERPKLIK